VVRRARRPLSAFYRRSLETLNRKSSTPKTGDAVMSIDNPGAAAPLPAKACPPRGSRAAGRTGLPLGRGRSRTLFLLLVAGAFGALAAGGARGYIGERFATE